MTRRIKGLGCEELLNLVIAVTEFLLPLGNRLDFCVGVLAKFSSQLAHGAFNILWQRFEGVPGDVAGWNPAALNSLFIKVSRFARPHLVLEAGAVANGRNTPTAANRTTRHARLVFPVIGHLAVNTHIERTERETFFIGKDARVPLMTDVSELGRITTTCSSSSDIWLMRLSSAFSRWARRERGINFSGSGRVTQEVGGHATIFKPFAEACRADTLHVFAYLASAYRHQFAHTLVKMFDATAQHDGHRF